MRKEKILLMIEALPEIYIPEPYVKHALLVILQFSIAAVPSMYMPPPQMVATL
jgi:hypothetical protein